MRFRGFTQRELDELRKSEEFFRSQAAGAFQAEAEPGPLGFSHEAYERLREVPALVQPIAPPSARQTVADAREATWGGPSRFARSERRGLVYSLGEVLRLAYEAARFVAFTAAQKLDFRRAGFRAARK